MISPLLFQNLLLDWFEENGRTQLPWQHPRTPYRVWISEIMLQQTQVTTVIPYFERFMRAFPTISHLAEAHQDTVLHLWAGLGYYARARHLHQTALRITKEFNSEFPDDLKTLESLPGIGRSTAGAILSLGFNQPAPILDGNVKRIFSRLHAIDGLLSQSRVMTQLWQIATAYTSVQNPRDYTQAIMDFGSLVCTRQQPRCSSCPMMQHCLAYQKDQTDQYPSTKSKPPLMTRQANFLILINTQHKILLEKRPPVGIWGGLWSVPEYEKPDDVDSWCRENYGCSVKSITRHPIMYHTFSHFRLAIQPLICYVETVETALQDNVTRGWFQQAEWHRKGLAAPVQKLLQQIFE